MQKIVRYFISQIMRREYTCHRDGGKASKPLRIKYTAQYIIKPWRAPPRCVLYFGWHAESRKHDLWYGESGAGFRALRHIREKDIRHAGYILLILFFPYHTHTCLRASHAPRDDDTPSTSILMPIPTIDNTKSKENLTTFPTATHASPAAPPAISKWGHGVLYVS